MTQADFYSALILNSTPRVLSQIDRDPHSLTYGSCDRHYWHYKMHDFSSAILQQAGLALAILYQLDFAGNIYYGNENVKEWATSTVRYWAKIQLKDGSYNEYYPSEHGYPPTAFTLFTSSQVYLRLGMEDPEIEKKIRKTATFLTAHAEQQASNQEMAAVLALYSAFQVIGDPDIETSYKDKLAQFLQTQSDEGWFNEQGGADIGYLSVTLDMMGEYYAQSGDDQIIEPMSKIVDFLQYFIHPDGSIGGEYASRSTTYFLPNGLEVASRLNMGSAVAMANHLFSGARSSAFLVEGVDDRYFSHYVLHSFVRALEKSLKNGEAEPIWPKLPFEVKKTGYFPQSGLLAFNQDSYQAIVGLQKGGVIKVFSRGNLVYADCGYRMKWGKNTTTATNWQDSSYEWDFDGKCASANGKMNIISQKTPNTFWLLGLRVAAKMLGKKINTFLKKLLIHVDKHIDVKFHRDIFFEADSIVIKDSIRSNELIQLEMAPTASLRTVASGKFFDASDLQVRNEMYPANTEYYIISVICPGKGGVTRSIMNGEKNDA